MRRADWLLDQLPLAMVDDPFLAAFVRGLQQVADTVVTQVDGREHLLDPGVAPLPLVPVLAGWIGLHVDSGLPEEVQRTMLRAYARELPRRGTAGGLQAVLAAFTGGAAAVDESGGVTWHAAARQVPSGARPDPEPAPPAPAAHVRVRVASTGRFSGDDLVRFVRSEAPASATMEVWVGDERIWPVPAPVPAGAGGAVAGP